MSAATVDRYFIYGRHKKPVQGPILQLPSDVVVSTAELARNNGVYSLTFSVFAQYPWHVTLEVDVPNKDSLLGNVSATVQGRGGVADLTVTFERVVDIDRKQTARLAITATEKDTNLSTMYDLSLIVKLPTLALALDTMDDATRHFDDYEFWGAREFDVATIGSSDYAGELFPGYLEPMGSHIRLDLDHLGRPIASAEYQVHAKYQQTSLRELLSGDHGRNVIFADKARSAGGTIGELPAPGWTPRGDLFFDFDDSLMAYITKWSAADETRIRLGTAFSDTVGTYGFANTAQIFAGVGVHHRHNDSCILTEYAPITTYCPNHIRYGTNFAPIDKDCRLVYDQCDLDGDILEFALKVTINA
eukprot:m.159250 g.159250  ORF g.159250 m.159250 type:complete len:360 (-) comp10256_c1_seq1:567-1646(-)